MAAVGPSNGGERELIDAYRKMRGAARGLKHGLQNAYLDFDTGPKGSAMLNLSDCPRRCLYLVDAIDRGVEGQKGRGVSGLVFAHRLQ